jgi:hypothetical protein
MDIIIIIIIIIIYWHDKIMLLLWHVKSKFQNDLLPSRLLHMWAVLTSEALIAVYYTLKGTSMISYLSKQGKQITWKIRIFIWIWFYPSILLIRVIQSKTVLIRERELISLRKLMPREMLFFRKTPIPLTAFPHPTTSIQHYRWFRPTTFFTRDHTLAEYDVITGWRYGQSNLDRVSLRNLCSKFLVYINVQKVIWPK